MGLSGGHVHCTQLQFLKFETGINNKKCKNLLGIDNKIAFQSTWDV